jgi:hypothetical protein
MGKGKYGKGYDNKGKASKSSGSKGGGAPIRGGKIKASHILVDKFSKAQELFEDMLKGIWCKNFGTLVQN